jgi:hypothetical protein
MADHICIRIWPNDKVSITDEKGNPLTAQDRDGTLKKGKEIGQAFWWNENPTCVWYKGKQY